MQAYGCKQSLFEPGRGMWSLPSSQPEMDPARLEDQ